MNLSELLSQVRESAIEDALQGLSRVSLPHYSTSDSGQNRIRLAKLYDLTLECVQHHTLAPITEYARTVARERYRDGFDLQEVHTAFNVVEEVIWRKVISELKPPQYPEALGLASTVLGAGKQALAVEYVTLASNLKVQSLDLSAMFKGTV